MCKAFRHNCTTEDRFQMLSLTLRKPFFLCNETLCCHSRCDGWKKEVPFFFSQQILTHYAHQCIQKSCNLGNILCTKAASACSTLARKKTQWGKKNQCSFHRLWWFSGVST